jgi:hypothetical protein
MPSPSKNKGNSFERQTAEFLTNLYGEKFIRAPGSGAYVGGKNSKRKEFLHEGQIRSFKGDIVPGMSFPRFNGECKSYKEFPFHQLFSGNIKLLDSWIDQCMDASDEGDFNIIFMKFNRIGTYIAAQISKANHFKVKHNFIYQSKNHGEWLVMDHRLFWDLNSETVKHLSKAS